MFKMPEEMDDAVEVNFDGIVGPTHNYGGLSYGNTASQAHQFLNSNPKEAALQGLEKMKFLLDRGIKQAVLPPHERPFFYLLRKVGFSGKDHEIIQTVSRQYPDLLLAIYSAAAMWTANAATVCPSADSGDRCLHLTPANLSGKLHRSIEANQTAKMLKAIFTNSNLFTHHESLPEGIYFADEGAANHLRFCRSYGSSGVQLFVYGRSAFHSNLSTHKHYPARQTKEASEAIARLHQLDAKSTLFVQQHPDAIDAGAFHNDVMSVGNKHVFLFHERAFVDQKRILEELQSKVAATCRIPLILLEAKAQDISLKDAVTSYLFNSQILSLPNGKMLLLAPLECQEKTNIASWIESLIVSKKNPIEEVHYLDLKQSMQNGGGPACLRLRVVLTPAELKAVHQGVFLTESLYQQLKAWIHRHYRDRLNIKDLSDPQLIQESQQALNELAALLNLHF
jgi:succinylarginine dihydrolase